MFSGPLSDNLCSNSPPWKRMIPSKEPGFVNPQNRSHSFWSAGPSEWILPAFEGHAIKLDAGEYTLRFSRQSTNGANTFSTSSRFSHFELSRYLSIGSTRN